MHSQPGHAFCVCAPQDVIRSLCIANLDFKSEGDPDVAPFRHDRDVEVSCSLSTKVSRQLLCLCQTRLSNFCDGMMAGSMPGLAQLGIGWTCPWQSLFIRSTVWRRSLRTTWCYAPYQHLASLSVVSKGPQPAVM